MFLNAQKRFPIESYWEKKLWRIIIHYHLFHEENPFLFGRKTVCNHENFNQKVRFLVQYC